MLLQLTNNVPTILLDVAFFPTFIALLLQVVAVLGVMVAMTTLGAVHQTAATGRRLDTVGKVTLAKDNLVTTVTLPLMKHSVHVLFLQEANELL